MANTVVPGTVFPNVLLWDYDDDSLRQWVGFDIAMLPERGLRRCHLSGASETKLGKSLGIFPYTLTAPLNLVKGFFTVSHSLPTVATFAMNNASH